MARTGFVGIIIRGNLLSPSQLCLAGPPSIFNVINQHHHHHCHYQTIPSTTITTTTNILDQTFRLEAFLGDMYVGPAGQMLRMAKYAILTLNKLLTNFSKGQVKSLTPSIRR